MEQSYTDQTNRVIKVNWPPQRIVSLVPSQTELLYDLGLNETVVGQTVFCIRPSWAHEQKTRVGGTKKPNIEKIRALKPDLIIGNKEENTREHIELLAAEFPVWLSDIRDLNGALDMIRRVGKLVNRKREGDLMAANIQRKFEELAIKATPKLAAYFIWYKPWMVAGNNTFIQDMMSRCGLKNVFGEETSRYPEVDEDLLMRRNPEVMLLSSEPYPFKQKHLDELAIKFPQAHIELVDGELFSWYGSRLLKTADYLQSLLRKWT